MKERGLIFSAPMVRSILAGTKTQTRRIVKPSGNDGSFVIVKQADGSWWPHRSDDGESVFVTRRERGREYLDDEPMRCPYGRSGDRLWVKETHHSSPHFDCLYRADYDDCAVLPKVVAHGGWKPSIHMPRRLSRITLEITAVRVERLHDISGDDAAAEGVDPIAAWRTGEPVEHFGMPSKTPVPVLRYAKLWESLHGPGSWDASPWVWVVAFRRVQ